MKDTVCNVNKYILFHGTPKSRVKSILKKGFIISTSDTHWMGKGVYFYDERNRASLFVKKVRKNAIPAVVKAILEVKKEKILDLVNNDIDKMKFADFIKTQEPVYDNSIRLKNSNMHNEKERDKCIFLLKCAIFDYYCLINEIELAISKHNTHPGSYRQMMMTSLFIEQDTEIQYCAKTLDIIKSIDNI
jgi:hypothetical protein